MPITITTLEQSLDFSKKEIQTFKIIHDNFKDICVLPEKLYKILDLMNCDEIDNEAFKKYIEIYPTAILNKCIECCKENYQLESERDNKLIKIKQQIGYAIYLFKIACGYYNVGILSKEIR